MNVLVRRGCAHFVLAALQACVAVVLLDWALPLFTNPKILGNGLGWTAHEIDQLVKASAERTERLMGVGALLRWLFARHTECVFAVLAVAGALLLSAAATAFLGVRSRRGQVAEQRTRRERTAS